MSERDTGRGAALTSEGWLFFVSAFAGARAAQASRAWTRGQETRDSGDEVNIQAAVRVWAPMAGGHRWGGILS